MLGPRLESAGLTEVLWEGEKYTFFGGNDYHRFSSDPITLAAFTEAAQRWGINSAGSRMTTANHPLYNELEQSVAAFLGAEDAVVFSAGYMSNTILLQAIAPDFTHLLLDAIAHASLVEAALQTGKELLRFKHCDVDDLKMVIGELPVGAKPLILTDGVFPSSGVIPPLAEYAQLGLKILIDDAHGMAVVGPTGKGSWEQCGLNRDQIYQTGTFSKGLGGFGGVVLGDRKTMDRVRSQSAAFTGSTPPPLPVVAASIASIETLTQHPEKIDRIQRVSSEVKDRFRDKGFRTSVGPAPICSVTFLDEGRNRELGERLKQNRIYPVFINYPGCPPGGHFRFTLSSAHTDADIERLIQTVESAL